MSKMSELYINLMEEYYNSLSKEEIDYINSIDNQHYIFWEQNYDNSP